MNRVAIDEQVGRILTLDDSPVVDVIVQVDTGDDRDRIRLSRIANETNARRSAVSPRDMIPVGYEQLVEHARSTRSKKAGAPSELRSQTINRSKQKTSKPLTSLNDWQQEIVRPPMPTGAHDCQGQIDVSGARRLQLTRDDLYRLVRHCPAVRSVYLNRSLSLPSFVRSRGTPRSVWDRRGHTWGLDRIGAMAAWGAFGARGAGIKVAVLDTGIDATHPDLVGKVSQFAEFGRDGEIVREGVSNARDHVGHGTHVAATVAGGRASGAWIGVAPDAQILAGGVLTDKGGTDLQILAGMQWALEQEADIISMSLGGLSMTPEVMDTYTAMIDSANLAGVPVIIAIGNDGAQTSGAPGNDLLAFSVGATDNQDLAAGFSGGRTQVVSVSSYFAPETLPIIFSKPDVSAPGVEIFSALPDGKWETASGTSMATPHVAGAMAILLSGLPRLRSLRGIDRVSILQDLLSSSVQPLGESGQNHRFGFGRIDVLQAMGFGAELGYLDGKQRANRPPPQD